MVYTKFMQNGTIFQLIPQTWHLMCFPRGDKNELTAEWGLPSVSRLQTWFSFDPWSRQPRKLNSWPQPRTLPAHHTYNPTLSTWDHWCVELSNLKSIRSCLPWLGFKPVWICHSLAKQTKPKPREICQDKLSNPKFKNIGITVTLHSNVNVVTSGQTISLGEARTVGEVDGKVFSVIDGFLLTMAENPAWLSLYGCSPSLLTKPRILAGHMLSYPRNCNSQGSFSLLSPPALIQIPPLLDKWMQCTSVTFPAPCLAKRHVALPITEGDLHKIQIQLYHHTFFCLKFFIVLYDWECHKPCSAMNGPGVWHTDWSRSERKINKQCIY